MKPMIKTGIEHAATAMVLQIIIAFYLFHVHGFTADNGLLAGGIAACTGYVFREMAQHEYKGGGPTKVSGTYGLLNHWTLDSVLDIVLPIITTGVLWILLG